MDNTAIRVNRLSKSYQIGSVQKYQTLRDSITNFFFAPLQRVRRLIGGQAYGATGLTETIWALDDLTFEVNVGEIVGIIGRNGAGKSTLLKVLSRITPPTHGSIDVWGKVGALLEVGTGFHQELTGRENIYLNGAILGMPRSEIDRKFDEIVAFAEVEKYIDTPVKFYSSGMGLRLGFAVAAHLEPEILIIDEVLAVGDIDFQKKCIGKMDDVAQTGRTVLFVSHNMAAVRALCQRGIVLDQGRITFDGPVGQAIQAYQKHQIEVQEVMTHQDFDFLNIRFNGQPGTTLDFTQPLSIDFTLNCKQPSGAFRLMCVIDNVDSNHVLVVETTHHEFPQLQQPGNFPLRLTLPPLSLAPGTYSLYLMMRPSGQFGLKHKYSSPTILIDGTSGDNIPIWKPILCPDHEWCIQE